MQLLNFILDNRKYSLLYPMIREGIWEDALSPIVLICKFSNCKSDISCFSYCHIIG